MYALTGSKYFGGQEKDLLKTSDGGKTWRSILGNRRAPVAIAINPIDPNLIYLAADKVRPGAPPLEYLFKTTDGGETWDDGVRVVEDLPGRI